MSLEVSADTYISALGLAALHAWDSIEAETTSVLARRFTSSTKRLLGSSTAWHVHKAGCISSLLKFIVLHLHNCTTHTKYKSAQTCACKCVGSIETLQSSANLHFHQSPKSCKPQHTHHTPSPVRLQLKLEDAKCVFIHRSSRSLSEVFPSFSKLFEVFKTERATPESSRQTHGIWGTGTQNQREPIATRLGDSTKYVCVCVFHVVFLPY